MTKNPAQPAVVTGWILALTGALLTVFAWMLASPSGSAPDDNFHVATIWCGSVWHDGRCEFMGEAVGAYGQDYYLAPAPAAFLNPEVSAGADPPCYVFKTMDSGDCPPAQGLQKVVVNSGLYPPLYYWFAGLFAAESQDRTVLQVRLAVSLSVLALFAAAYAVTLRWLRPAYIASLAVGLVPVGLSIIPSTNPSAWAVAGVAASWSVGASFMLADTRRRRLLSGLVWVVAVVMACGSRSDAAAYIALITLLTVALLWRRSPVAAHVVGLAVLALSGLAVLTSGQTANVTTGFQEDIEGRSVPGLALQALKGIPSLLLGGTGAPGGPTNNAPNQLGWFDVPVPPVTWVVLLLVIGALVFTGIVWLPWQKAVYLGVLLTAALALPFYTLLMNKAIPGELVQPRYLLPLLLAIFGASLARSARNPLRLTKVQVVGTIVLVSLAQAAALHVFMRRYVTGMDVDDPSLTRGDQWWWPTSISPDVVWLLGSAGWAMVVAVALLHFAEWRAPAPGAAAEPDLAGRP